MNSDYDEACLPKWDEAKPRGQCAVELFKDVLEFKDVRVFDNLSKADIIAELDALYASIRLQRCARKLHQKRTGPKKSVREIFRE